MKPRILIALLVLVGSLAFGSQARAQAVDGYTSIDYDDSTGLIDAYSETSLDYDVECYYQASVSMQVYTDSGYLVVNDWDQDSSSMGFISVEDLFYAESDTTYTANGTHSANAYYYDYDYDYDPDYGRYRDYYVWYDVWFFGFYEDYDIYEPWYYYFQNPYGFQPQRTRRNQRVTPGKTHDSASTTTPGLKPHHLVVHHDSHYTNSSCDSIVRVLQFEVWTAGTTSSKRVTDCQVRETFTPVTNTCNGDPVTPSDQCRPLESDGTFTDELSTLCPIPSSSCGFSVKNQWQWCPPSGAPITIGTLNNTMHPYEVLVNTSAHFDDGFKIFRTK